ncbi:MAG TPA: hypothetical protein VL913_00475 [Candidatus Micrarchaeaceae archaeon]|nr:hypothetical protein [Candidatus Micrarchaeaceae archaeon]
MASARAMIERRRSSRVLIRIPVRVFGSQSAGQPLDAPAETIAVSRCGALLRVPFSPQLGARIEVLNGLSQETREFRIIRVGEPHSDGLVDVGVEILHPGRSFWGIQFPDESRFA